MKIYFVRHGESEANTKNEFSNRSIKHPLTPGGVRQANALGLRLKGVSFAAVYTSPILRAIQTTEIVCEGLGIPSFVVDYDLREYDVGIFEGRSDKKSWTELARLEESWTAEENQNKSIEGGESFAEIQERFERFHKNLVSTFAGTEAGVLVVSHGGLLKVGLPKVVKDLFYRDLFKEGIGNCEVIVAETVKAELGVSLKRSKL